MCRVLSPVFCVSFVSSIGTSRKKSVSILYIKRRMICKNLSQQSMLVIVSHGSSLATNLLTNKPNSNMLLKPFYSHFVNPYLSILMHFSRYKLFLPLACNVYVEVTTIGNRADCAAGMTTLYCFLNPDFVTSKITYVSIPWNCYVIILVVSSCLSLFVLRLYINPSSTWENPSWNSLVIH